MSARSIMLSLCAAGSLAALGAACGSTSSADELFGNPGNTGGDGGSATTASASSKASTAETGTSSGMTTSSTGEGGASTSSSSVTSSVTTTTSSGPSDVVVFCAGAPCMPGQVCCFNLENGALDACGGPGTCGPGTITLSCNGPEDCPGGVCCGDWNGQNYNGVACQPQCNGLTMCAGDPEACEPGQQCLSSNYLGEGYGYCQ